MPDRRVEGPIRVLELRTVRGTGGGPEKTILLGTARTDPARYAITVCYIRDERDPIFHVDERAQGLPVKVAPAQVRAVPTTEFPTPAKRPMNSRLDTTKLRRSFGLALPPWEAGVHRMLREVYNK